MRPEVDVAIIVVALDGRVLDRTVHPLELTVPRENSPPDCFLILGTPRVIRLGQTVLDPICLTDHVETHLPRPRGVPIPGLLGELNAVVRCPLSVCLQTLRGGQNRMDPVGHDFHKVLQELPGSLSIRFFNQLNDGKFAGAVNGYDHKELAFRRLHLGDVPSHGLQANHCRAVDVEKADRVALELRPLGLVSINVRQAGNPVSLEAPVQRRPCQVRDRGLRSIEAVVQRQQRVTPKRDDRCLIGLGENRGSRFLRHSFAVLNRRALAPLRDRLRVNSQLPAQLRERSLPLSGHCVGMPCRAVDRCIATRTACVPSRQISCANRRPGNSTWRSRDKLVP